MAAVLSYGRLAAAPIPGYHSTKSRYRDKTALQHSKLYPAALYTVPCSNVHCTLYTVYYAGAGRTVMPPGDDRCKNILLGVAKETVQTYKGRFTNKVQIIRRKQTSK